MGTQIMGTTLPLQIRWMIRRDMPEVLDIEQRCFAQCWSEENFLCALRQRNTIGMIAEHQEAVIAFMVYQLKKAELHILNFAVHPQFWRSGVGSEMVAKLVAKLTSQRREKISVCVREGNLPAQQFWRAVHFAAKNILSGYYEDTGEDAYRFVYTLGAKPEPHPLLRNRISEFLK